MYIIPVLYVNGFPAPNSKSTQGKNIRDEGCGWRSLGGVHKSWQDTWKERRGPGREQSRCPQSGDQNKTTVMNVMGSQCSQELEFWQVCEESGEGE